MESTDLKQPSPDAPAQESAAPAKPVKVPKPRKKRKWLKRVIALVVLAAVILVLLRACSGGGTALTSGVYLPSPASMQHRRHRAHPLLQGHHPGEGRGAGGPL